MALLVEEEVIVDSIITEEIVAVEVNVVIDVEILKEQEESEEAHGEEDTSMAEVGAEAEVEKDISMKMSRMEFQNLWRKMPTKARTNDITLSDDSGGDGDTIETCSTDAESVDIEDVDANHVELGPVIDDTSGSDNSNISLMC